MLIICYLLVGRYRDNHWSTSAFFITPFEQWDLWSTRQGLLGDEKRALNTDLPGGIQEGYTAVFPRWDPEPDIYHKEVWCVWLGIQQNIYALFPPIFVRLIAVFNEFLYHSWCGHIQLISNMLQNLI